MRSLFGIQSGFVFKSLNHQQKKWDSLNQPVYLQNQINLSYWSVSIWFSIWTKLINRPDNGIKPKIYFCLLKGNGKNGLTDWDQI